MRSESQAAYAPPGYLLFMRESDLMAQPFDAQGLELHGNPFPVARGAAYQRRFSGFSVSNAGVLAYLKGGNQRQTQLSWVDRTGKEIARLGSASQYQNPRLSPSGDRIVVGRADGPSGNNIWIFDVARGIESKLTDGPGSKYWPVWSPDGSRIVFTSYRDGGISNLYIKSASGTGQEDLLLKNTGNKRATDWSPDGRYLVFMEDAELWLLPLDGDRKPFRLPNTPKGGRTAQFSFDGRWLVYASDESGRGEIYVQCFPPSAGKWQVSRAGGASPFWRRDARELFFWSPEGDLMAVDVLSSKTDAVFKFGVPLPLFRRSIAGISWGRLADITPDGKRFLVNSRVSESERDVLTIVLNWTAGLNK
jgi:dipeptidyl aminopeptidase/acylaminoacyl peptidase